MLGRTDQFKIFRFFEFYLFRHFDTDGFGGDIAVADGALAVDFLDDAIADRQVRYRNVPFLRGGFQEHSSSGGAGHAQGVPAQHDGEATAGKLGVFEGVIIQHTLLDDDVVPTDVELFGDDHGHGRHDVLPDLGVGRIDRDQAVIADLDVAVDLEPFFRDRYLFFVGRRAARQPVEAD